MRGMRFSLRWMFGLVSFLAVGCGLLVYATPLSSLLTLTAALFVLLTAVVVAACHTGERRAFWAGFAFFGLAYGWIICGSLHSPGDGGALSDRLATTALLGWCHQRAPHTQSSSVPSGMFPGGGAMGGGMMMSGMGGPMMGGGYGQPGSMGASGMGGMMGGSPAGGAAPAMAMTTVSRAPEWSDFATTGHSLFALGFAMLGGLIAARCYERAERKASGSS